MSPAPRLVPLFFALGLLLSLPLMAQTDPQPGTEPGVQSSPGSSINPASTPNVVSPAAPTLPAPAPQVGPASPSPLAGSKADALLLYRQGRDLETAGRMNEANASYTKAIATCDSELAADPRHMDSWAVKCWCLFRLNRHQEVVDTGTAALKLVFDARVAEVMGESWYYLGRNDLALKSFQRYLESGQFSDRIPTAYFYLGETYLRMKKWSHADIAYSTAVKRDPSLSRWWFRLGQVCENLGDWKRASDAYSKALSLTPSLKEAADGVARMKPKLGA